MVKQNVFLLSMITLAIYTLIGVFAFWLFYPYKTIVIDQPVKVLTKEVKPGDAVIVEFTFDKYTEIRPEIDLSLVDGVIYHLPSYSPKNEMGHTEGKIVNVMDVPDNQPCGTYHLHWEAKYKMNPFRDIDVSYDSEEFTVDSTICAE